MSFTANNSKATPQVHPSQAPREPTGQVASDSLAAESLDAKGGFSENAHAAASSVPGASSTLNTTDTSGARVLQPAPDGAARDAAQSAVGLGGDEKGVSGVKLGAGTSTGSGPAGASDFGASTLGGGRGSGGSNTGPDPNIKSSGSAGASGTTGTATGTAIGIRPHVDAAPGYTASVTGAAAPPGTYRPKGTNLEDADETESMPKTKTFTGDVGGHHDPARLAEQNFAARNTGDVEQNASSGKPGGAQRQAGNSSGSGSGSASAVGEQGGSFGVLDSERA
ncbi:hypothetical protein RBB50_005401 [Rhinocladiella similis]